mmetsp:Transcript_24188/g.33292  ORF Transcript_24188/g.33292 Transcript_24188/m.33292 type:complete len:98 (-) Transcript_24188:41-334(-)
MNAHLISSELHQQRHNALTANIEQMRGHGMSLVPQVLMRNALATTQMKLDPTLPVEIVVEFVSHVVAVFAKFAKILVNFDATFEVVIVIAYVLPSIE